MTQENILVELVVPTGTAPGENVQSKRYAQVVLAAPTTVVDGVTYTRTSPLRTVRAHGGMAQQYPLTSPHGPDSIDSYPPVGSSPGQGVATLAIFSQSGT